MKVLTKLIFVQVIKSSLFVLLALVALFAFFDLIGQSSKIGTTYSIYQAFMLTALVLPMRGYQVLPIAVMLGAIFTLSRLAATSQFTVMRVSGVSPWRFASMLMLPGILMVLFAFTIGEYVAPPAHRYSKEAKLDITGDSFSGKDLDSGIWVRDVVRNDKNEPTSIRFVNVSRLKPGEAAYNWKVYVFNPKGDMTSIVTAKEGRYSDSQGWILKDAKEEKFPLIPKDFKGTTDEKIEVSYFPELVWGKHLDGNIFGLLMVKPEYMSLQELYHYIEYLKSNGQTYKIFETAFWSKMFYPFAILVMLILAMPFAYQSARAGGMAIKIFCGIMIGILYYALNNIFAFISVLQSVPSFISALMPSVMMLILASIAMWFVERRS